MTQLTQHFTLEELGGVGPIPAQIRANLQRTAELLERIRAAVGNVPLRVTSGYRSPAHNSQVGGVSTSQHMDGTAADVIPQGITHLEFHQRLSAAEARGEVPDYGQLIYYPFRLIGASSGHIHLSLPTRGKVRERLVRLNEHDDESGGEKYTTLSAAILTRFPGAAAAGQAIARSAAELGERTGGVGLAVLVLVALAALLLLFAR